MAPKRQIGLRSPSSTDSEAEHARKRFRSSSPASESEERRTLRIYIVQAKVDVNEMQDLYRLIDDTQADQGETVTRFELTTNHAEADVIITKLRMKKRFERHIPWNIAVSLRELLLDLSSDFCIFRDGNLLSPQPGFVSLSRTGILPIAVHTLLSKNFTLRLSPTAPLMTHENLNKKTSRWGCRTYHCRLLKLVSDRHLVVCWRTGKPNMPVNAPRLWFA